MTTTHQPHVLRPLSITRRLPDAEFAGVVAGGFEVDRVVVEGHDVALHEKPYRERVLQTELKLRLNTQKPGRLFRLVSRDSNLDLVEFPKIRLFGLLLLLTCTTTGRRFRLSLNQPWINITEIHKFRL